ncbi:siphovirus ReqiPepy6 Gp37-like family protein [Bacillus sp. ISL-75]|uniref:siphovirus ReqiPepy6 Gp37-like family protein n=1 Tax=Bacillus sp. ISL-75 TaxID=2819137 RepID=UPI001BEBC4F6|nr:siphovirus ReqiPepy6 Gp37-like family protein [Bacillus sp. ISL-75]MBT2728402.1 siphovirus ReqiPepy6 Gp37-like family protein [Bacillus sp. ISL-75]
MKSIQINIFTTDLVWKAAIDNVKSFVSRSSWYGIVNSELTISRTAQGAEELVIGRIIIVNNDLNNAMIIEEINASIADDYWNLVLIPLKGMLNYRICHPIDTGSFTAKTQAEIMMQLASKNLVTQYRDQDRYFWNAARTLNMFSIAAIKNFGDSIDFTVDWGTGFIGEAIVQIANMFEDEIGKYPIGWNVYIKNTFNGFVMDTYSPTNRSINQTINPPVVFSEDFNNIKDANYANSIRDWATMAYMTWNDGTNDQTTAVASVKSGTSTGFTRKEIILDSNKTKSSEVISEGRAEINKRPKVENFTAEILDNPNTMSTFGVDWFLGDIVTVQTKALKPKSIISVDTQIIEIEEIYDNGEYSLNATFGESKLSLIKKIKQAINSKR